MNPVPVISHLDLTKKLAVTQIMVTDTPQASDKYMKHLAKINKRIDNYHKQRRSWFSLYKR